jgi:putative intracellular protease/amidase
VNEIGHLIRGIMTDTAYLLVLDGFADWEASLAASEINKSGQYHVVTVGLSRQPVRSMGGLLVQPDIALDEFDPERACVFMLPGGTSWEQGQAPEVTRVIQACYHAGIPIAALCGATLGLARAGVLEGRRHTSNAPGYLQSFVPGYGDEQDYVESPAVRDGPVVTASGMGGVEFAYEIISLLDLYNDAERKLWLTVFRDKVVPPEAA